MKRREGRSGGKAKSKGTAEETGAVFTKEIDRGNTPVENGGDEEGSKEGGGKVT